MDHEEDQWILISQPECGLCSSLLYHHGKLSRPSEICFNRIPGCKGFPGATVGKNPLANAGDSRDAGLISGSGRSPGEGNGSPLFLPGKFPRQRSQTGYSLGDRKESDMTKHAHTLERITRPVAVSSFCTRRTYLLSGEIMKTWPVLFFLSVFSSF